MGQHRSTQRHVPHGRTDEARLVADMIELARQFGRYGYRRIAALLRDAGWSVSDGRIERLWRREGLKVPQKQPKKGRLWLNDGSCVRLRPEYRNHAWSYDIVVKQKQKLILKNCNKIAIFRHLFLQMISFRFDNHYKSRCTPTTGWGSLPRKVGG